MEREREIWLHIHIKRDFTLRNCLMQLWRLTSLRPTRHTSSLEILARVHAVVLSPKAVWRKDSFLLADLSLFS